MSSGAGSVRRGAEFTRDRPRRVERSATRVARYNLQVDLRGAQRPSCPISARVSRVRLGTRPCFDLVRSSPRRAARHLIFQRGSVQRRSEFAASWVGTTPRRIWPRRCVAINCRGPAYKAHNAGRGDGASPSPQKVTICRTVSIARKLKDHGEGGAIVGAALKGRVADRRRRHYRRRG